MSEFCFETYRDACQPSPDYLFHYTKAESFIEKIMVSQTLMFNCRSESHDPLERNELPTDASAPAMPGSPRDNPVLLRRMEYGRELNQIRDRVKYACFCVDSRSPKYYPWTKGCLRSRMWSQYSDGHKGVCLVFDRNKLSQAVKSHIRKNDSYFTISKRVRYFHDLDSLYSDCSIDHQHDDLLASTFLREKAGKLLFSKIRDYRDENEYRIVLFDDSVEPNYIKYKDSLVGIILGQEISNQTRDQETDEQPDRRNPILEFAREHALPTALVNWYVGRPKLEEINRNK